LDAAGRFLAKPVDAAKTIPLDRMLKSVSWAVNDAKGMLTLSSSRMSSL
jgi:hypothetical protein